MDDITKIPANERTFQNTGNTILIYKILIMNSRCFEWRTIPCWNFKCYLPISRFSRQRVRITSDYLLIRFSRVRDASVAATNKLEEFSVEQKTREDLHKVSTSDFQKFHFRLPIVGRLRICSKQPWWSCKFGRRRQKIIRKDLKIVRKKWSWSSIRTTNSCQRNQTK